MLNHALEREGQRFTPSESPSLNDENRSILSMQFEVDRVRVKLRTKAVKNSKKQFMLPLEEGRIEYVSMTI